MTITAFTDNRVFRNAYSFDFCHGVAGETVASAFRHFFGVGAVAFDAGRHRFVAQIGIDRLEKRGMAAHAVPRARPHGHR